MKYFQGNLYIFGGIVEDMPNKVREDILIYNLSEKKFSIDYTLNKNGVGWRSYHIAELIGPQMFIYAGADEKGNIVANPFALDLFDMKWIQAKFTTDDLPKRNIILLAKFFLKIKEIVINFFYSRYIMKALYIIQIKF
jgi:hypothetical protein